MRLFKSVANSVVFAVSAIVIAGFVGAGPTRAQYPPPVGSVSASAGSTNAAVGSNVTLTATVLNAAGQGVGGVDCTFSIASEPGTDATVGSKVKTVQTGPDGRAFDTLFTGSTPGVIIVRVTAGSFASNVVVTVANPAVSQGSAPLPPAAPLIILPPNTGDGGLLGAH